jgi:hypothetical protein
MRFFAPDDGGVGAAIEKAVDTVVTTTPSPNTPEKGGKEKKPLDDEGEYFVRRIGEEVRKALAEVFPAPKPDDKPADEEEVEENGKKVRRKRKPPAPPAPAKSSFLKRLKFPGIK